MLIIYTLSNCDTCRAATKWLRSNDIQFEERAIRKTPPSPGELEAVLAANGGEVRKLFNTAGRDYREQRLGEKVPHLTLTAAIGLLAGNGNLVKRPLIVGNGVALVGFNQEVWTKALLKA